MQLLDSPHPQLSVYSTEFLLSSLEDIVTNVRIEPNFCISHPNYKPLKLPDEVAVRFQQVSLELQNKYLSVQLRNFLYGIYYNASLQTTLAPDADSVELAVYQDIANNTLLGIDVEFSTRLHESNTGEGYFEPGWGVIREESDGALAVLKAGLTLHIDRDCHLDPSASSAKVGDLVAIRMPKNLVQNGFYMAVSNTGIKSATLSENDLKTVRIYFNLTPEGAVNVMKSLTQHLNEIKIPFLFKVLYNPSDYNRYDSGVLYFDKTHYEVLQPVLLTIYQENKSYFKLEVPLFTKSLAPGLSLAEEPDLKFAAQESFGMNRCQIVANGLLQAQQQGDESPKNRMEAILQQFSVLELDWQYPYLNAKSEDIYTPLQQC